MNFGTIMNPAVAVTRTYQAAEAAELQTLITAALSIAPLSTARITSISLSGGGDGHTFVAVIQGAAAAAVSGGVLGSSISVRCFLAGSAEELAVAQTASGVPATTALLDTQVAGASKGTRFMGLSVFAAQSVSPSANDPMSMNTLSGVLGAAATVATITSVNQVNFSLVGTQGLKYDGAAAIIAAIDVDLVVQATAAGAFPASVTVDIVRDPLGTPVVLATQTIILEVDEDAEAVGLTVYATLQPTALSAILDRIGVIVTMPAGGVGSIVSGQLRVIAV